MRINVVCIIWRIADITRIYRGIWMCYTKQNNYNCHDSEFSHTYREQGKKAISISLSQNIIAYCARQDQLPTHYAQLNDCIPIETSISTWPMFQLKNSNQTDAKLTRGYEGKEMRQTLQKRAHLKRTEKKQESLYPKIPLLLLNQINNLPFSPLPSKRTPYTVPYAATPCSFAL